MFLTAGMSFARLTGYAFFCQNQANEARCERA